MNDEDPTSWNEDLRQELIQQFLAQAVATAELAEVDLPHVVICRDVESGALSYSGPFPNGIAALTFAEQESAADGVLDGGDELTFSVAALYPIERTR